MRKTTFLTLSLLLTLAFAGGAMAQKSRFVGTFVNEDPNTDGVTKVTLYEDDTINVWGRCQPTDCNWGEEIAYAYGASVQTDLRTAADAVTATYVKGFATKFVLITPLKDHRIRVDVFTRFTDRTGRTAFAASYELVREDKKKQQ